ncbi:MAG TPA: response regulator [Candidatus Limnocylindria bacterium]|jgi:two-component system copper resistance phosphate regulon response regulator CusR|nr:response regulator [Candidatus Limnocylindria bacterium]
MRPAKPGDLFASLSERLNEICRLRVLVVEDHLATSQALAKVLRHVGFSVNTALDGLDGLTLARSERFDVLVSDLELPRLSGYELMKLMRQLYATPGIALTAYGSPEHLAKSREAGFSEHFEKPISVVKLVEAIQRVAQQS